MKNLFIAIGIVVCMLNAPQADARNVVLTGEIEADTICHDGANRGANIRVLISVGPTDAGKRLGQEPNRSNVVVLDDLGAKGYYTRTTCHRLDQYNISSKGTVVSAWAVAHGSIDIKHRARLCKSFTVKYVKGAGTMWIQTGGFAYHNVTCVAKDSI